MENLDLAAILEAVAGPAVIIIKLGDVETPEEEAAPEEESDNWFEQAFWDAIMGGGDMTGGGGVDQDAILMDNPSQS